MSIPEDDNPYTPPLPVDPETAERKTVESWGCCNIAILIFAAPFVLFCLFRLLPEVRLSWAYLLTLLFVTGYFGMCFRKAWAYTTVFIVAMIWVIRIVLYLEQTTPDPSEPGLAMIFTNLYVGFAIYSAIIAVFGAILALSGRFNPTRNLVEKSEFSIETKVWT